MGRHNEIMNRFKHVTCVEEYLNGFQLKVFVVIRVDKNNDKVVWKVYKTEQKAKDFCEEMSNDEYKFRYEDWIVR